MSSDYKNVKLGKLKLKGQKEKKKVKRKRETDEDLEPQASSDAVAHGGWWNITSDADLKPGPVAIETFPDCYLLSMDNGKFTIGAPHEDGEGPAPEEILSVMKPPDAQYVTLKSGYDKYVGVNAVGQLSATADAVGSRERWEFVFQEGQVALQSLATSCFVSFEVDKEGYVYAKSRLAKEKEMIKVRTNLQKAKPVDWRPDADKKKARDAEMSYQLMYQHSKVEKKDRCISIDLKDAAGHVRKAQEDGSLHETLLDRRVKTKSDRYC